MPNACDIDIMIGDINDKTEIDSSFSVLKYVDFIHSKDTVKPIIDCVESLLGIKVEFIQGDIERSGPKEEHAVHTFSSGQADFGRI